MELIKITTSLLVELNYWAILSASIAMFIFGMLWYGPIFGKQWMKYTGLVMESGQNPFQKKMMPAYLLTFVGNFVEATFLLFFTFLVATQFWHMALMLWLGFMVFSAMGPVLWEKKSWGLFFLNSLYRLGSLLVGGFILALFF